MPEHETASPWLLPYPGATGKVSSGATNIKELAERTTTIFKEKVLIVKAYSSGATLKSGELAVQGKTGETFTLPAATTANQIIGVFSGLGITTKVTTSGGASIVGDFVNGATITLTSLQHVILVSEGTNWFIIAGEPKRTNAYSAIETFGPYTSGQKLTWTNPSASREAWVNLTVGCNATTSFGVNAQVRVGGVHVGDFFSSENAHSVAGGTSVVLAPSESLEVECTIGGGGTSVTGSLSYRLR
jgi:hypothetical protein